MNDRVILRPSAIKALTVPLISVAFFGVVIAAAPGSEWFNELSFFVGLSAALAAAAVPFLLARIDLSPNGDVTVRWLGIIRHRFNAQDVVAVNLDPTDSYPRLLWLFSLSGTNVVYRTAANNNKKIVLTHSLYWISNLKRFVTFLVEHGAPNPREPRK